MKGKSAVAETNTRYDIRDFKAVKTLISLKNFLLLINSYLTIVNSRLSINRQNIFRKTATIYTKSHYICTIIVRHRRTTGNGKTNGKPN